MRFHVIARRYSPALQWTLRVYRSVLIGKRWVKYLQQSMKHSAPLDPVPSNTIVHTAIFISNPRPFTASKVVSKEEDDKIHPQGDDHSASQLDPSTTTAITLDDTTVNICQNIVISIIKLTPPSLFATAYPEDTPPQVVPIQSLNVPSWHYTISSSRESAHRQTSIMKAVGESEPIAAKPWSPLSASVFIGLSSSVLAPPYLLNFSTAFPSVPSGSARYSLPNSISKYRLVEIWYLRWLNLRSVSSFFTRVNKVNSALTVEPLLSFL